MLKRKNVKIYSSANKQTIRYHRNGLCCYFFSLSLWRVLKIVLPFALVVSFSSANIYGNIKSFSGGEKKYGFNARSLTSKLFIIRTKTVCDIHIHTGSRVVCNDFDFGYDFSFQRTFRYFADSVAVIIGSNCSGRTRINKNKNRRSEKSYYKIILQLQKCISTTGGAMAKCP